MSNPVHRPFFCDPNFFPSPPKSFLLPFYAKELACQFERHRLSPPSCGCVFLSDKVLEFVDTEAIESDGESLGSNEEQSTSTSSS